MKPDDPPHRRVRQVIEQLVRDGTAVARSDGSEHTLFPVAATPAALCANGDPAARHVVIDPHQATRFANCGLQFLEDAGVAELVEHYREESQIALPRFVNDGRSFDLAFVDGNHRFDGVFLDLVYLGRLVRPGGIVFLDDYQLPAIVRAASFFLTNRGWTLEEVAATDERHHWAVLRTSDEPDTRPFHHFVEF